jgi:hypothetical protein
MSGRTIGWGDCPSHCQKTKPQNKKSKIMPNLCSNQLTITGPKADVKAFREKAPGQYPWWKPEEEPEVLNFHSLVPIPENILAGDYESAGYDWEMENWGCKWGAQDSTILDEREEFIAYEFLTAWSPPMKFLETVAKQWPALQFVLEYDEPGIGFKGLAKFRGELHEDHCISL